MQNFLRGFYLNFILFFILGFLPVHASLSTIQKVEHQLNSLYSLIDSLEELGDFETEIENQTDLESKHLQYVPVPLLTRHTFLVSPQISIASKVRSVTKHDFGGITGKLANESAERTIYEMFYNADEAAELVIHSPQVYLPAVAILVHHLLYRAKDTLTLTTLERNRILYDAHVLAEQLEQILLKLREIEYQTSTR
ncbi:MAG: hypothetical protein AB7F43_08695 [Bacteriovoracia bacterium]